MDINDLKKLTPEQREKLKGNAFLLEIQADIEGICLRCNLIEGELKIEPAEVQEMIDRLIEAKECTLEKRKAYQDARIKNNPNEGFQLLMQTIELLLGMKGATESSEALKLIFHSFAAIADSIPEIDFKINRELVPTLEKYNLPDEEIRQLLDILDYKRIKTPSISSTKH